MGNQDSMTEFTRILSAAGYAATWEDTGGGCTALQIEVAPDRYVLVTDAPYSLCGEEAHISTPLERAQKLAAKREKDGCAYPGVQGDGSGFLVGWSAYDATDVYNGLCIEADDATGDDLPFLVEALLKMIARRMGLR